MPKYAKNELTIETLDGGGFRLFGYAQGKRVRRWSADIQPLEILKGQLEAEAARAAGVARVQNMIKTELTLDEIKDAEAAFRVLRDRPYGLLDCVEAASSVLGTGAPKAATEVRDEWLADMQKNRLADRTMQDCRTRLDAFLKQSGVLMVGEISAPMIETYCFGTPKEQVGAANTVGRGRVLQTFLNFAVGKLYLRVSPFRLKMKGLVKKAKELRDPVRTLTPAQCQALLTAAIGYENGMLVPYIVLSTWCFMRNSEVQDTLAEHIDFGDENLVFANKKKNDPRAIQRQVTIPDNMVGLLKECFDRGLLKKGEPVAFTAPHFDNVRELAGLITRAPADRSNKNNPTYRKITGGIWQENLLRHTGFSYLYKRSGNIDDCCRQAGNSPEVAFEHYVKMTRKADADAFYAITGKLLAPTPEQALACA